MNPTNEIEITLVENRRTSSFSTMGSGIIFLGFEPDTGPQGPAWPARSSGKRWSNRRQGDTGEHGSHRSPRAKLVPKVQQEDKGDTGGTQSNPAAKRGYWLTREPQEPKGQLVPKVQQEPPLFFLNKGEKKIQVTQGPSRSNRKPKGILVDTGATRSQGPTVAQVQQELREIQVTQEQPAPRGYR